MTYHAHDLNYKGENCGVHNWMTPDGHAFYWHPDWLHIAEDQTGIHPKEDLAVTSGEKPTREHAVLAILKHLNGKMVEELNKIPLP
ncbi:hypothetical protein NF212_05920 [Parasalinivibrio latis]|uniref:hypothetical protein n=1 Tax=Parasalinivibrio latis TaxID=2952610 RepID=UPI0030E11B3B